MFDFEARVLIGWLPRVFACQPIRTCASKSNIVFMLRWLNRVYLYLLVVLHRRKSLTYADFIRSILKLKVYFPRNKSISKILKKVVQENLGCPLNLKLKLKQVFANPQVVTSYTYCTIL